MKTFRLKAPALAAAAMLALGLGSCSKFGGDLGQAWTSYADPGEHAFTLEVPAGWQVAGGLQRLSAADLRIGVSMKSPDGKMELFYGDRDIPSFAAPSPMLEAMGIHPGMTASPIPGASFVVEPYMPGEQFAGAWGAHRVSGGCGQVAKQASQPLPDVARTLAAAYGPAAAGATFDAGQAIFGCVLASGAPAQGLVFSATEVGQTPNGVFWTVPLATGFIAAKGSEAQAKALLVHVLRSVRIDPAWAARQPGAGGGVGQLVIATNEAAAKSLSGGF